jgi:hypothetical protein
MKKVLIVIALLVLGSLAYYGYSLMETSKDVAKGQRWMENRTKTIFVVLDVGRGDSIKARYGSRIEVTHDALQTRLVVFSPEKGPAQLHTQIPVWFTQQHTRLAE